MRIDFGRFQVSPDALRRYWDAHQQNEEAEHEAAADPLAAQVLDGDDGGIAPHLGEAWGGDNADDSGADPTAPPVGGGGVESPRPLDPSPGR